MTPPGHFYCFGPTTQIGRSSPKLTRVAGTAKFAT